ncbi:MAG: putative outer membrane protein [Phormidium sp. OSCR]|nr:MAG: putative outer membrane protein [Phormidium sp. OSCR]
MSQSPPPDPNTARSRRDRRRGGRSAPSTPPSSSGSFLGAIAVFILRLLILGVSLSLGVIGGVAWAQMSPQANPQKPLSERWRVQIRQITNPAPSSPTPEPPPADLDRDQLQDRIVQLQEQVTQLNRQLAALTPEEAAPDAPGNAPEDAPEDATAEDSSFESQKTDLQSQVTLIATQLSELQAIVDPPEAIAPPRLTPGMPLRLTLPSDVLFSDSGEVLDPTRASILDRLLDELQTLEGATVYIGGYLDETDDEDASLEKTFEQAKQVEQYLASNTDTPLRWVSIGYGSSRFAASNSSPANRQRNRRIEIRVKP